MLKVSFNPFPILTTECLNLREIKQGDALDIFQFRSNKEAMQYIGKPLAKGVAEVEELIKRIEEGVESNTAIAWGISLKNSDSIIGTIGFHKIEFENYRAEIGYMLHPSYWRQGLMNEAIHVILNFGFLNLNFNSIQAIIEPNNIASSAILTKHKFVKEAYFRENYYFNGHFQDSEIYSILKSSYIG